jgi:hypothetical protein
MIDTKSITSARFFEQQRAADWMPLSQLNLWRNPFGELSRDERILLAVIGEHEYELCNIGRWEAVQFIGDCGNGKTTRMLCFHKHCPNSSYVYLPEDEPCPSIAEGNPVLVDEAQRLPRRVMKELFATGLPLILATHKDLRKPLEKSGYTVKTVAIGNGNRAEHIQKVLNRRIESSRLSDGQVPTISLNDAKQLHKRFGGDIRSIEHHLYEEYQGAAVNHAKM